MNSGLVMEWKESGLPQFEETFYVFWNLVGNIEENHEESYSESLVSRL